MEQAPATKAKQASLRELNSIPGFYQQQSAYRLANNLRSSYKTEIRIVQRLRETSYHVSDLEARRLKEGDRSHERN
jgi:hypothetical protein